MPGMRRFPGTDLRQHGAVRDCADAQAGKDVLARQVIVQVDPVSLLDALDAIEHAISVQMVRLCDC